MESLVFEQQEIFRVDFLSVSSMPQVVVSDQNLGHL